MGSAQYSDFHPPRRRSGGAGAAVYARLPLTDGRRLNGITMAMALIAALDVLACWRFCICCLLQRQRMSATFYLYAESSR